VTFVAPVRETLPGLNGGFRKRPDNFIASRVAPPGIRASDSRR
jgi:hypothetical protein